MKLSHPSTQGGQERLLEGAGLTWTALGAEGHSSGSTSGRATVSFSLPPGLDERGGPCVQAQV